MALEKKSEYVCSLSAVAKQQYEQKVTNTGLKVDPYIIDSWTREPEIIPKLQWSDIMLYMISTPSPYTKEAIKAWKGMLDSEGFVKAGWVHDLLLHKFTISDGTIKFVVKGKRMSATPLLPWAILENDAVAAAHCTCMAGIGEACSRIAALLSCVVQASQARQESGMASCTSQKCQWLPPTKNASPAFIRDISFVCPSNAKQAHNQSSRPAIKPPSQKDLDTFMHQISMAKCKPAILKITPPYSGEFIPTICKDSFPKPISELYNPEALHMDYLTLLNECETMFESLKITPEQVIKLEEATREQSSNKTWFVHRAGRITASNMKAAAWTSHTMPSQSLIKRICYPEIFKFSTPATRWGCMHEESAIETYRANASKTHEGLLVSSAGLFVDSERPYIGASPDGVVSCSCCGQGALEIKCPLCIKDRLSDEFDERSTFCMEKHEGQWMLKRNHAYYYQVQTQLNVCRLPYCDFVVWTESTIIQERITVDAEFYEGLMDDIKHFFMYGVLPEIVGKWYTRKPIADSSSIVPDASSITEATLTSSSTSSTEDTEEVWCYCRQPNYGSMIGCSNDDCTIQWFHFECMRIRRAPKGDWYCPSCRKLPRFSRKKKINN